MKLERIEVWDGLEADSGNHQATIERAELLESKLAEDINGGYQLSIRFDRASVVWADIQVERVLRAVYDDDTVQEYRIIKPDEERTGAGAEQAIVRGRGIIYDLRHGLVNRVEADGTVTIFYTLNGQTRANLVSHILGDARTYFSSGTITDSTKEVDVFTFNLDNPLKALQELAAIEELELAVRRNGATDFLVDLVTAVGSGATVPEFRYRKNMTAVKRIVDGTKMANRIYAGGGGDDAVRLSVGQARFKVATVVDADTIVPDETVVFTDDHLVGAYLERPDKSRVQISDTIESSQQITTSSAHNLSVGDRFQLRVDAAGVWLQYVEDPDSQAAYGILTDTFEANDLEAVTNLLENPKLTNWSGSLPADWTAVGGPTIAEETQEKYTKVGGSAAKVTASAAGQGIQADAVTIAPSDPHKFYTFHVEIFVESGKVELYAQHSVDGRFPAEGEAQDEKKLAYSSKTGEWVHLYVEGKEWQAGTVQLRVIAKDGAATFYVDAAQLTRTSARYPFFEGDGGAKLWERTLQDLAKRNLPLVTYAINAVDLTAVDSSTWPYDEVTLGGTVVVEDEQLTLSASTRVLKITRDLLQAHIITLQLSNKREDLIDRLTLTRRRMRQLTGARSSLALVGQFKVSIRQDGTIVLQVFGAGACKSFRYIVDLQTMPTYAEVVDVAGDGVGSDSVDGAEVVVSDIRETTATKLGPDQRAYIRIVVYPVIGGAGTPGATDLAISEPPTFWYAEITSSSVNQTGSSPDITVRRTFPQVDARCAAIHIYRRKTNWPTIDGTQATALDPAYDRGLINARDGWEYKDNGWANADVVRDIAVAIDAQGRDGEREEYSYTVTGTAGPQFTTAARYDQSDGTSCEDPREVRVQWTTSGVTDGSHDVRVYRRIDGGGWVLITTVTDPVTTTSYDDEDVPMYYGGLARRLVDYRLDLWDGSEVDDSELLEETRGGRYWYLCDYSE